MRLQGGQHVTIQLLGNRWSVMALGLIQLINWAEWALSAGGAMLPTNILGLLIGLEN